LTDTGADQLEPTMRILVVEDDRILASAVKRGLEHGGFAVDYVTSAEQAQQAIDLESFDLLVVDIGLPGMSGLELLQRLRQRGDRTPVIILTARDALEDRVDGLELGADDYMVKPFELPELTARVRALIRRSNALASSVVKLGALEFDSQRRVAALAGVALQLTSREWAILEYLLLHSGQVVSKQKLLQAISNWDTDLTHNAIEVYVSRLRPKLEPGQVSIRTVRGLGYRLEADGANI
jgi:DNA-binding response OmpR family regulator